MIFKKYKRLGIGLFFIAILTSCLNFSVEHSTKNLSEEKDLQYVMAVLENHLTAVSTKNLTLLKQTLSPSGEMELVLPEREITTTVASFVEMHEAWFQEQDWTFDWKILTQNVGTEIAIASVEVMYREPDRNGKPYFNRMIVGYGLRKEQGNWYVIKDQACSMEKSEN